MWISAFLIIVPPLVGIALTWLKFPSSAPSIGFEPIKNPERTHIAHHKITGIDELIFQHELYDGFFGDGSGTVVVKLAKPLQYSIDSWLPISQCPKELIDLASTENEHFQETIKSPNSVWCIIHLKRNAEHISNLVLACYNPENQILIERIIHT